MWVLIYDLRQIGPQEQPCYDPCRPSRLLPDSVGSPVSPCHGAAPDRSHAAAGDAAAHLAHNYVEKFRKSCDRSSATVNRPNLG